MSIEVRPIYSRLALIRPDLASFNAAQLNFIIQEAIREVCRRTWLARETATQQITDGTQGWAPTLTAGRSLVAIHWIGCKLPSETEYLRLEPASFVMAERDDSVENMAKGRPTTFSQQGDTFKVYPPPDATYDIKIKASYTPTMGQEVTSIALPEYAFDALVLLAESMAYRVPGSGQDKSMGLLREKAANGRLGSLRALALGGESAQAPVTFYKFPGVP